MSTMTSRNATELPGCRFSRISLAISKIANKKPPTVRRCERAPYSKEVIVGSSMREFAKRYKQADRGEESRRC